MRVSNVSQICLGFIFAVVDHTQAQREDELTMGEGENLQIIEESEGDGWIKVTNFTYC